MVELLNLGISEQDFQTMIETNPDLEWITEEEIINLIHILKQIGCKDTTIKNIVICNPFYFTRTDTDIIKLLKKLLSIGLKDLNSILDANPYLLNKDAFEIDHFLNKNPEYKNKIADLLEENPYIMEEE